MSALIEVNEFSKFYLNKFTRTRRMAVDSVSFKIQQGQIYGLIGPNGSGKTTTIKAMLGFIRPTSGNIKVLGKKPSDSGKNAAIGFMPEESYYHEFLTVNEELDFFGSLYGINSGTKRSVKIKEVMEITRITPYKNTFISELSRGNLQRLGIAQSMMNDPELFIYDEPASGIDPVGRYEIREILSDLSNNGKTIFMSSHFLPEIEKLCSHIGIILNGKMLYDGSLDGLNSPGDDLEEKFMNLVKGDE